MNRTIGNLFAVVFMLVVAIGYIIGFTAAWSGLTTGVYPDTQTPASYWASMSGVASYLVIAAGVLLIAISKKVRGWFSRPYAPIGGAGLLFLSLGWFMVDWCF